MGWPADANGDVAPQPRDSASGPRAGADQPLVGGGAADLDDRPQRQPAGDRDARPARPATTLPVTVEYFDNLGALADAVVRASPRRCAAAGDRADQHLDAGRSSTRRRASRRGSYELVFSDAPPNAGAPAAVTGPSPAAPLLDSYDAATGDITLDLGNQTITVGVGSTGRRAAAPEPALLDLLAGRA